MCELLGGEADVEEQKKPSIHRRLCKKDLVFYDNSWKWMKDALDKMEAFCKVKRNIFLPIKEGLHDL